MQFLTKQEIFDKVVQHLLTQGVKSMDEVHGWCMYRGPNGIKCAVGALITDEVYTDDIENEPAAALFSAYRRVLEESGIDPDSQETEQLLVALQDIHDREQCGQWRINLESLAELNGLVFNMKG